MKNRINLLVFLFLLIIIQISIINNGIFFGFFPNIVLMYTIYISQKSGRVLGSVVGLISGLIMDVLLSPNLGIKALSYLIVGYFIGLISEYIFEENARSATFYILLGTILFLTIDGIIYFFLSYNVEITRVFSNLFSVETVINIFAFLLIQESKMELIRSFKLPKIIRN